MTTDADPPGKPSARRRIVPVALFALLAGALWAGLHWADEPLRRKYELLRTPIRLVPGETVSGRLTREHGGLIRLQLVFSERDRDAGYALWQSLKAPSSRTPAPLELSYRLQGAGATGQEGTSNERDPGWGSSGTLIFAHVSLASEPTAVEVRVVRASPDLAGLQADLQVAASGDWIHYAWLSAWIRRVGVLAGAAVAGAALIGALWVSARRRKRADAGRVAAPVP